MDYAALSLKMHEENVGKLETVSKIKLETKDDLAIAYTPGVAAPCLAIAKDKSLAYKYTLK
jgi:malate dehydrogenase (oxaloacetate-decarboxylating)